MIDDSRFLYFYEEVFLSELCRGLSDGDKINPTLLQLLTRLFAFAIDNFN